VPTLNLNGVSTSEQDESARKKRRAIANAANKSAFSPLGLFNGSWLAGMGGSIRHVRAELEAARHFASQREDKERRAMQADARKAAPRASFSQTCVGTSSTSTRGVSRSRAHEPVSTGPWCSAEDAANRRSPVPGETLPGALWSGRNEIIAVVAGVNPIAPQSMLAALPSSLSKLLPSEQSQGASTDTRMRGFHSSAASQCDELGVVNKHTFQQQADNVSKGAHAQSAKHPFSVGGAIRALFPVPKKGVPALTKDQHVGRGSISTPRTAEEAW